MVLKMFKALSRFFGLRKVPSIISKLPSPHAGVRTNKSPQETSLVLRGEGSLFAVEKAF